MHETNEGTAFVVKLPAEEIESVRGSVPMRVRHELYSHPAAPVIRTVVTIFDQPERPLGLETFTNIDSPDQRVDFAGLGRQQELLFLFYDEALSHRLSKRVGNVEPEVIEEILAQAQEVRWRIHDERFDFDQAKADVLQATHL